MKITIGSEYYNEIHCKWMPVPSHWIGTDTTQWTDRIIVK